MILLAIFALAGGSTLIWKGTDIRRLPPFSEGGGTPAGSCPSFLGVTGFTFVFDAVECWYQENRGPDEQATMVLLASAGGGLRAAVWTAQVLAALDDNVEDFNKRLFAISAVSGGALGATLYRAALTERESGNRCPLASGKSLGPCLEEILRADFVGPLVAAWLSGNLLTTIAGPLTGVLSDRAAALEMSWEAAWRDTYHSPRLGESMGQLWPHRPWSGLILNTTLVRSGQSHPISNLLGFRFGVERGYVVELGSPVWRASTAAGLSARFPIFQPGGRLVAPIGPSIAGWGVLSVPTPDERGVLTAAPPPLLKSGAAPTRERYVDSIVDGGYADNYGATALGQLLMLVETFQCRALWNRSQEMRKFVVERGCREVLREHRFIRYVIIQVTSDPDLSGSCDTPPTPSVAPGVARSEPLGASVPLLTLFNYRIYNGLLAASGLHDRLTRTYAADNHTRVFSGSGSKNPDEFWLHTFTLASLMTAGRSIDGPHCIGRCRRRPG